MRALFLLPLLVGCVTIFTRFVDVQSTEPVAVEQNGVLVCEKTPCQIRLKCRESYTLDTIEAVPLAPGQFSQRKIIRACELPIADVSKIRFDPTLRNVAPVQSIDVH